MAEIIISQASNIPWLLFMSMVSVPSALSIIRWLLVAPLPWWRSKKHFSVIWGRGKNTWIYDYRGEDNIRGRIPWSSTRGAERHEPLAERVSDGSTTLQAGASLGLAEYKQLIAMLEVYVYIPSRNPVNHKRSIRKWRLIRRDIGNASFTEIVLMVNWKVISSNAYLNH